MDISAYIDHTFLKPAALIADIEKLCSEGEEHHFAAICVPPPMIKIAKNKLQQTNVKVATVIGFPFGYSAIEAKLAEIILAIIDGVDEIDMVINLIALKNNDWQYLANEINHIIPVIKKEKKVIKIIIETGILTGEEIIRCCELYSVAEVDFLKTSTGYAEKGATIEAVELMRKHLPPHIQIKASGGIKTYAFAKELIDAGATRIGSSNSVSIIKEYNN